MIIQNIVYIDIAMWQFLMEKKNLQLEDFDKEGSLCSITGPNVH